MGCGIGCGRGCVPPIVCRNSSNQTTSSDGVPYDSAFVRDSVNRYGNMTKMCGRSSGTNIIHPTTDICLETGFGDVDEFHACQRLREKHLIWWLDTGMNQADRPVQDVPESVPNYAELAEAEARCAFVS